MSGLLYVVKACRYVVKACGWVHKHKEKFSKVIGFFAGLGFLSLYLSGKIKAFDRKGHVAKLCIVFMPLLFASLIGISRVDDYWHHWQDVFAGGLLGWCILTITISCKLTT